MACGLRLLIWECVKDLFRARTHFSCVLSLVHICFVNSHPFQWLENPSGCRGLDPLLDFLELWFQCLSIWSVLICSRRATVRRTLTPVGSSPVSCLWRVVISCYQHEGSYDALTRQFWNSWTEVGLMSFQLHLLWLWHRERGLFIGLFFSWNLEPTATPSGRDTPLSLSSSLF